MVRRQVLKMTYNGEWTVLFVTDSDIGPVNNPYKIYYKQWLPNEKAEFGYKAHKKKVAEYADFYSCLCFLKEKVVPGDIHNY